MLQRLRDIVLGPEAVRWTGELYAGDTEFRLAVEDGVPPKALEAAANAASKAEFRERVLDSYYAQF